MANKLLGNTINLDLDSTSFATMCDNIRVHVVCNLIHAPFESNYVVIAYILIPTANDK
jgi:hypothetical protein